MTAKSLKILMILPSPPNHLNRIRSLNLIRSFKKLGHHVTVISLYKNSKEKQELYIIRDLVDNYHGIYQPLRWSLLCCIVALCLPIPLRVAFCFSPYLYRKLCKINKQHFYDIIYLKRCRMAQYRSCFRWDNVYIDFTDSMTKWYQNTLHVSQGYKRLLCWEEYLKHRIYEAYIANKHTKIIICSKSDRDYLIQLGAKGESFIVLENGIRSEDRPFFERQQKESSIHLVFWWVMNVETNINSVHYFLDKIFPHLPNNCTYTVIGPNPPEFLKLYTSKRINFLGHVDDLQEKLKQYDLFVCSIIAWAGTKNKVLQSLLSWLPLISSALGIDGLDPKLQKNIYSYTTSKELINYIKHFSKQNKRSSDLEKLRSITVDKYDITKIVDTFISHHLRCHAK